MSGDGNPNRCYTEDTDTKAAIIAFMRHHKPEQWPDENRGDKAVVNIRGSDGQLADLLTPISLQTELEVSGRKAFAVVLDAETNPALGWEKAKAFASVAKPPFKNFPNAMPEGGLCAENQNGVRFGMWIMPDNKSKGMLEDWLRLLVPADQKPLWDHAVACVKEAREKFNSGCKEVHLPKAHLHTLLAFKDPPGERIGAAIGHKILDPDAKAGEPFLKWFNQIFQL
jgi:hypothetical protein